METPKKGKNPSTQNGTTSTTATPTAPPKHATDEKTKSLEEPALFPDRELPPLPTTTFTVRDITLARKNAQMKQRVRLSPYYISSLRFVKEIQRYSDKYISSDTDGDVTLSKFLAQSIERGMFPSELTKKTKLVRRKKVASKTAESLDFSRFAEDEVNNGEEGDGEEGEGEGEGKGKEGKEKKKGEGEGEGEEEEEAEEEEDMSDNEYKYTLADEKEDGDDYGDEDGGGGGDDEGIL